MVDMISDPHLSFRGDRINYVIYILRLHRGHYDRGGAFHAQAFIVQISAAVEHSQLF